MKVRWRQHETIAVLAFALITIVGYKWTMLRYTPQQMEAIKAEFAKSHVAFNYFTHNLLPQIGCIIILLLAYFTINRVIIPNFIPAVKRKPFTLLGLLLLLFVIANVIGQGINFISFYSNPYRDPNIQPFPLSFGFHPQPFNNNLGGLDTAIGLILVYLLYASVRELIIYLLEKPETRKEYKIAIYNQLTVSVIPLLVVPFFCNTFDLIADHAWYSRYFAFIPVAMLVFNINIYILFPLKKDRPFFSWPFIGPLLFTSFVLTLFFSIFLREEWSMPLMLCFWAAQVLIVTPISWIDYQQRKDKVLQLRGVEEALVRSTTDLKFLRSQINPHFLFNALNTLYGTALLEGSKNTADGIQKLGDMMRFMLHDNNQPLIPMEKEIEYLKNYIVLQKLRTQLSPDITIEDNIAEQNGEQAIAPMLLIPFVENAFKHGVSLTGKSWIKINLMFEGEKLIFEVRNSLHPSQNNDTEKNYSGIGLKNVKERLVLLYRNKHQFMYGPEGDEFVAKLTLDKITAVKKKVKLF